MMADAGLQPSAEEVKHFLAHITRRWGELDVPCKLETRCLTRDDRAAVKDVARFDPTPEGIAAAVQHMEAMNGYNLNAYAVINPVNASAPLAAGKAARDEDIVASFFHWADADDKQAADNIRSFVGPRPTFVVITGTAPVIRPHVYWELEEPALNMAAWTATQRAIAATLGTDPTVVNPSRIMRIAGTVNWPKPQKQAKGYIPELTRLTIHDPDDRPPVTSERMSRAFSGPAMTALPAGVQIDVGVRQGRNADDFMEILRRARTDGEKHGGVRDLTSSLAGQGVNRAMTEAIVKTVCPVWDEGVEALIRTAYDKFHQPPGFEVPDENSEIHWPTPYDFFDEAAIAPRQWIYGNHYLRKFVSVLASAGGIGKTSLQIVEALAIVTGKPLLGEPVKEQCNVWLVNLEDPIDEMQRRVLAAMRRYGIRKEDVRGKLFVDAGRDFSLKFATQTRDGIIPNDALVAYLRQKIPERQIGCVFIDPFVGAHNINENDNMAVNSVVSQIRDIADNANCAIGLVHHIRKGNGNDADIDSVRGAGSLIGAARAARVINKVSEKDALELGVSAENSTGIFRVDDGKANLSPPAQKAMYRRMEGVQIANGEWVGVATPFDLPDEWSGMTESVINTILGQINSGIKNVDTEEYFSPRPQDKERWVGQLLVDYPFSRAEDFKSEGQAKQIIKTWLANGLLEVTEYYSAAQRKQRQCVMATGRIGEQK